MPTSTHDLIRLAKQLRQGSEHEATLRCAISRSYYAALHRADEVFPMRDQVASRVGEGTHEKIIARAQVHGSGINPGRTSAQSVAKLLPKMKRMRVKADYQLDEAVSPQECDDAIERAQYVMSECEQIAQKMRDAASPPIPAVQNKPTLTRIR